MNPDKHELDLRRLLTEAYQITPPTKQFVEDLHSQILYQMDTVPQIGKPAAIQSPRLPYRSRVMIRRAAAAVLIALSASVLITWFANTNTGHGIAFAEVQNAIRQMKTAIITLTFPNQSEMSQTIYLLDTHQFRREHLNGLAFVYDPKKGKIMGLNPEDKTAWFMPEPKSLESSVTPWSLVDRFLKIEQSAVEQLGRRKINGKMLVGFRLGPPEQLTSVSNDLWWEAWIDPESRLPVRIEEKPKNKNNPMTTHRHSIIEFEFDTPIDSSIFSMTLPEGYHMVESGPHFPKPSLPSDKGLLSPIISPGEGINRAQFGMTVKEVIEQLGPPSELWYDYKDSQGQTFYTRMKREKEADAYNLRYKSSGFELFIDSQEGLAKIIAVDGLPEAWGFRKFAGRTTEGIALGATRADVEQAYGAPSRVRGPFKYEKYSQMFLLYEAKMIFFGLKDGQVSAIEAKKIKRKSND